MDALQLIVDGVAGYVYEGAPEGTVAFVPAGCLLARQEGPSGIDAARYLASGWAEKNMRFSSVSADGKRIWPQPGRPVTEPADRRVGALLQRLRNVYEVRAVAEGS